MFCSTGLMHRKFQLVTTETHLNNVVPQYKKIDIPFQKLETHSFPMIYDTRVPREWYQFFNFGGLSTLAGLGMQGTRQAALCMSVDRLRNEPL